MIGLEPEKRGGPSFLAGDGEPLELTIIVTGLEQGLAIVIGRAIEAGSANVQPPGERIFPFEVDGPVAEKLDVRARHRRAARGIGDPPLLLAAHVILHQHGIHDPDERVELVTTVHFSADPPRAGLVERDLQIGAGVAVFIARSEFRVPARGGFADELRLVFLNETAGDL